MLKREPDNVNDTFFFRLSAIECDEAISNFMCRRIKRQQREPDYFVYTFFFLCTQLSRVTYERTICDSMSRKMKQTKAMCYVICFPQTRRSNKWFGMQRNQTERKRTPLHRASFFSRDGVGNEA